MDDNQPKGIAFFSVKTGETRYAQLEPQIQAYINSSDMGVNASRGQDFGWKLAPEWVEKVRAFRKDENKMERLVSRNGGQKVTTTQILYAIYGEQLRVWEQVQEDESSPYEEQYLESISGKPDEGVAHAEANTPADSTDSVAPSSDEVEAISGGDTPATSKAKAVASKK